MTLPDDTQIGYTVSTDNMGKKIIIFQRSRSHKLGEIMYITDGWLKRQVL